MRALYVCSVEFKFDSSIFMINPEVSYRLTRPGPAYVDFTGGARFWHLSNGITLTGSGGVTADADKGESWVDAVVRGGRIIWERGFGEIDRTSHVPATPASIFFLASPIAPLTAQPTEAIKIGFASPLTGAQAHYGKDNQNGAQMAIDDLNARAVRIGGIPVKFELVVEDDQADPKVGTVVAQNKATGGLVMRVRLPLAA